VTAKIPLQAVTGNRLRDGTPIYFAGSGAWSVKIADALTSTDGDALLADAVSGPLPLEAVGAYLIHITHADDGVRPVGLKEEIRAFGPTA
jgi:hypothetical protein